MVKVLVLAQLLVLAAVVLIWWAAVRATML